MEIASESQKNSRRVALQKSNMHRAGDENRLPMAKLRIQIYFRPSIELLPNWTVDKGDKSQR